MCTKYCSFQLWTNAGILTSGTLEMNKENAFEMRSMVYTLPHPNNTSPQENPFYELRCQLLYGESFRGIIVIIDNFIVNVFIVDTVNAIFVIVHHFHICHRNSHRRRHCYPLSLIDKFILSFYSPLLSSPYQYHYVCLSIMLFAQLIVDIWTYFPIPLYVFITRHLW